MTPEDTRFGFTIGDTVTLNQDYGTCRRGDVGVVENFWPDGLVVKMPKSRILGFASRFDKPLKHKD